MTGRRRDITPAVNVFVSIVLALTLVIVIEFLVRQHLGMLSSWWVLGGVG